MNTDLKGSHNPYFNRWFSAMCLMQSTDIVMVRHNPYFNRWFSAIQRTAKIQ